jgi:dTDP-4-amino-4,6-dideoxygalactose transaminase
MFPELFCCVNRMVSSVPFTDIYMDDAMIRRASDVLRSGRFVKGPEAARFEAEFAEACGAADAVAVSSGTASLYLALDGVGVGPGDEVFVPGHTFFASASPVLALGATPVFVDVDPDYYTMDPGALRDAVESADSPAAVVPVHIYGQVADMAAIGKVAAEYDLAVVEDACQAHLATRDGRAAGTFGDAGCFSFYPSKNMTVGGDGGILVTDDEALADEARALRNHGRIDGDHVAMGLNFRLDETNAAIGREQLRHLPDWNGARAEAAAAYTERLADVPEVTTPTEAPDSRHVYHLYVIRADDRDGLRAHLDDAGIGTGIHYSTPAHRHEAVRAHVDPPTLPVTEGLTERILSLPMHPRLTDEEIGYVCEHVRGYYA